MIGYIFRFEGVEDVDVAIDVGRFGDVRYVMMMFCVVIVLINFLCVDEEEEEKECKENFGELGVSFGFDRRAFAIRVRANVRLIFRFRVVLQEKLEDEEEEENEKKKKKKIKKDDEEEE